MSPELGIDSKVMRCSPVQGGNFPAAGQNWSKDKGENIPHFSCKDHGQTGDNKCTGHAKNMVKDDWQSSSKPQSTESTGMLPAAISTELSRDKSFCSLIEMAKVYDVKVKVLNHPLAKDRENLVISPDDLGDDGKTIRLFFNQDSGTYEVWRGRKKKPIPADTLDNAFLMGYYGCEEAGIDKKLLMHLSAKCHHDRLKRFYHNIDVPLGYDFTSSAYQGLVGGKVIQTRNEDAISSLYRSFEISRNRYTTDSMQEQQVEDLKNKVDAYTQKLIKESCFPNAISAASASVASDNSQANQAPGVQKASDNESEVPENAYLSVNNETLPNATSAAAAAPAVASDNSQANQAPSFQEASDNPKKASEHAAVPDNNEKLRLSDGDYKNRSFVECIELIKNTPKESIFADKADKIKYFMKKVIAAQTYGRMFSSGSDFKEVGINLAPLKNDQKRFSFQALDHLSNLSAGYLKDVKAEVGALSDAESRLLEKVLAQKWSFRHQSKSKDLNIPLLLSNRQLEERGVGKGLERMITKNDAKRFANNDFVFSALETSGDKENLPVHTQFGGTSYGSKYFLFDENDPACEYGFLTLSDQLFGTTLSIDKAEHNDFLEQFYSADEIRSRNEYIQSLRRCNVKEKLHTHSIMATLQLQKKGFTHEQAKDRIALLGKDQPIFSVRDMKEGLGYYLIHVVRNLNNKKFKSYILDKELSDQGLDKVINSIFMTEFHFPRMVNTANCKKGDISEVHERRQAAQPQQLDDNYPDTEGIGG